jgi:hypothetical protein
MRLIFRGRLTRSEGPGPSGRSADSDPAGAGHHYCPADSDAAGRPAGGGLTGRLGHDSATSTATASVAATLLLTGSRLLA